MDENAFNAGKRYIRGSLTQAQLGAEISAFVAESQQDPVLQEGARAVGVDPSDIAPQALSLEIRQSQGISDQDIQVIIQGVQLAIRLWTDVILPWIRHRRGDNAVGRELPHADAG